MILLRAVSGRLPVYTEFYTEFFGQIRPGGGVAANFPLFSFHFFRKYCNLRAAFAGQVSAQFQNH
jgi:hypothetical protein